MKSNDQIIGLVTGANAGIGKEVAIGLAMSGARVIMVCRSLEKGLQAQHDIQKTTGSTSIDLFIADLSSQETIRSLAKTINERYSKLHILINNAGLVLSKKSLSTDGIEMTLATNYLGPFLLTQLLTHLLEKSAPSRIINVSSAIHRWGKIDLTDLQYEKKKYQFMRAYAQSKLLMTIMTFELARRLKNSGVTVNCIHPGAVKTSLGSDHSHPFTVKLIEKWVKFFFITPKQAAKNIIDLSLSPQWENITGKYFVKGKPAHSTPITEDVGFANTVFEISEQLVGSVEQPIHSHCNGG